jgi:hypothetical protein
MSVQNWPRSDLERRLKALILAGLDMTDVIETATYLLGESEDARGHDGGVPWRVRKTLEAGLVVSYARPFTQSKGLVTLSCAPGLSDDLRGTHDDLLDQRKTVYAHTDDTPFRQVRTVNEVGAPSDWPENLTQWVLDNEDPFAGEIYEQWTPPTRPGLESIRALALANRAHFGTQIDDVCERIKTEAAIPSSAPGRDV